MGSAAAQSIPEGDEGRLAIELVGQLNAERAARGLHALPVNVGLSAQSQQYAEELARIQRLVHDDSGYAEIIGTGLRSGAITTAYMGSPTHRHLIVDPNHASVGIGVVCDAKGRMWTVARFDRIDRTLGTNRQSPASPVVSEPSFGSRCGDDPAASSLLRLYLAYYLRPADGGGLRYWQDQLEAGVSLISVSNAFAMAREFQLLYGAVDDREFVALVYRNVMQREPDAAGLSYWRSQMSDGVTRGEVMIAFSESLEFRIRSGVS